MLTIILAYCAFIWAIYVFIPNRGLAGFAASAIIASGRIGVLYLSVLVVKEALKA